MDVKLDLMGTQWFGAPVLILFFFFLQSFHLQPTGTPGTYLLQTSSSQGLPLTLTAGPTVTLAAAAPASPEQIIVHALSVGHLI